MSVVERERVEEVVAPREVTVADVLERAGDLLEEFGWCQFRICPEGWESVGRSHGPFCLVGAVTRARLDFGDSMYGSRFVPKGSDLSVHELAAALTGGLNDHWNDHCAKNKAEVVAALRTAAKEARI